MESVQENKEISREARVFANKTARSIAEIQQSVNNMADVLVFLEVLGYDDRTAKRNGFENLYELAKYVYNFVDAYDDDDKSHTSNSFAMEVPSTKKRLAESLSMIFPWLGSLVLLFLTGVSLWMAWDLPASVTTAFLAGVFLGLVVTEGLLQNYNRLFSFYYSQTNIGEIKRSIERSYVLAGVILSGTVALLYGVSELANIPLELAMIAAVSTVTISLHRISYVIMYALKKLTHIGISYAIALGVLAGVFFLAPDAIPDVTVRYFAALGSAFAVLSSFAMYHHYKIMGKSSTSIVAKNAPHFYSPLTVNDNTITSRFGVQLWECLPYFMYGTFYFILLFADRAISWFFNPVSVTAANGTILPLSFNSIYHIGADLALLVILPVAIMQYVITSPIYALVHNRAIVLKVSENKKIDWFLQYSYHKLMAASIAVSVAGALILNLVAPAIIIGYLGGSEVSMRILTFASAGAVFLSVFAANGVFMIFLGKVKALAQVSLAAAFIVIVGGTFLAQYGGFENIVIAYLAATVFAGMASTVAMRVAIRKAASLLFARYI
ncbi:hypothetical protein Ngar_c23240 [Candidatus Nitrososphaera gargensis Ga9.2]|uniref:Transmembrane protein n=1 Tax=Nitrososphaera gargensis (strain Ga9.2) TaxID=1237085 RepID=K0IH79_NITGG|nr:hypothetical protein [Candidatus Nitrososphaera gargensis]AFU59250.1 hypothetical protein Ngar_c23240 [Candidatus Nitrososphaera gargensis Ga9.2]